MDLILADANGVEERVIECDYDIDCGSTNDYQLTISYDMWRDDIQKGKRVYIPGTEYGGIVKRIQTSTETNLIYINGYTWRGVLSKAILSPDTGQNYFSVSGELNACINTVISRMGTDMLH